MVRNRILVWLFAIVLLVITTANAAVKVRVDRNTVQISDSIRVVFETDQDVSSKPDFSALDTDFDVLGTSQSTNVNIINGKMRRSASWTVDLMAKREGQLAIPAIVIGNEFTEPVTITVKPAATGRDGTPAGDIFLEVEVDTDKPYVQGQVIYTVRLLRAVQIGNASLTEPRVTGEDVVIERLGDDITYETTRSGRTLAVVERRYALFAQNSGQIVIEPLLFEGRVTRGRQSRFDPFARGNVVRVRSKPVKLEAQPIPAAFSDRFWLPAQQVFLIESWPDNSQEFRVGEPVTRTLTLRANGLGSSQLPEIGASVPDGIKQYPDQPALKNRVDDAGLVAIRQEKVALIPSRSGTFILPEVEIPWWNTRTNELEHARLPARPIDISPAIGAPDRPAPQVDTPDVITTDETEAAPIARPETPNRWTWLSFGLALGWLATSLLWLWNRRRGAQAPVRPAPPSEKSLVKKIQNACAANDANVAKDTLLSWADRRWPGSQARSLGDLAARIDGDLQVQIHGLSQTLYSESASAWDGAPLWEAFRDRQARKISKAGKPDPELEPLYL
jgi:hypothetical protein